MKAKSYLDFSEKLVTKTEENYTERSINGYSSDSENEDDFAE